MKKLILKITLFLLGILILDFFVLLLTLLGSYFFKTELYSTANHYPDSDVVIMGTSHAREGFNCLELEKYSQLRFYNLGRVGSNTLANKYLSQLLLKQNRRPKCVVLVLSYDDLKEFSRPHLLTPFVPAKDLEQVFWHFAEQKSWTRFRGFLYSDFYSQSERYLVSRIIGYPKNRAQEVPYVPDTRKGYGGQNIEGHFKDRPETLPATEPFYYKNEALEALKTTLQLWQEAGVEVFIIDTPEFIGTRLHRGEYDKYESLMKDLSTTYGAVFKSFNNPEDPFLNENSFFRDGGWGIPNSHLNVKGATAFAPKFAAWLDGAMKKPLLDAVKKRD